VVFKKVFSYSHNAPGHIILQNYSEKNDVKPVGRIVSDYLESKCKTYIVLKIVIKSTARTAFVDGVNDQA